jgi:hypothetical protein
MNQFTLAKSGLVITLIIFFSSFSVAAKRNSATRSIDIAGLVVNAQNLAPIESAKIYDSEDHLLGSSDKNGYYHIQLNYAKSGELYFAVKIVKNGFKDFVQHEHWGDLGDTKSIMYFGLKESGSRASSFSSFGDTHTGNNDLSYDNVSRHFDKVRKEKDFNDKLAHAKAGNEDVLVQIDNIFYITDKTGWIKLNSDKDLVVIDDQQVLSADKLNAAIKRSAIKWMTPLDGKKAQFGVYTKNATRK